MTSAEVGLPGSPITSAWPARPSQTGLPGLIATFEKISSRPSGANIALAKSFSPTEAPPVTTTRSDLPTASAAIGSIAGRSSRSRARPTSCAPHRPASADTPHERFPEWPRDGVRTRIDSSSPVLSRNSAGVANATSAKSRRRRDQGAIIEAAAEPALVAGREVGSALANMPGLAEAHRRSPGRLRGDHLLDDYPVRTGAPARR